MRESAAQSPAKLSTLADVCASAKSYLAAFLAPRRHMESRLLLAWLLASGLVCLLEWDAFQLRHSQSLALLHAACGQRQQ